MDEHPDQHDGVGTDRPARDFTRLPEPVDLAETVASHATEPPPDPTMGRDTETEFLLRNAGA